MKGDLAGIFFSFFFLTFLIAADLYSFAASLPLHLLGESIK